MLPGDEETLPGPEHAANNAAAVTHPEMKKPCLLKQPNIMYPSWRFLTRKRRRVLTCLNGRGSRIGVAAYATPGHIQRRTNVESRRSVPGSAKRRCHLCRREGAGRRVSAVFFAAEICFSRVASPSRARLASPDRNLINS